MKYFVWKRVVRHETANPYGVTQEIWPDDLTTGSGKSKHGEVVAYEKSEPGDLVFSHEITDEDVKAWMEAEKAGTYGSVLSFFANRYPFKPPADESHPYAADNMNPRIQDTFPEGEG